MDRADGRRTSAPSARRMIQAALLAILLAAVSGCGGTSASPSSPPAEPTSTASPAPTATATPSPSPTTAPTSTPAATPSVFTSTVYPYTLELPVGVLTRRWIPARVVWDGVARIAPGSLANEADGDRLDITGTVDGTLLVWGLPWDGDLAGFRELVRDNSARYHDCTARTEPSTFEVNGAQGVGQLEDCDNHVNSLGTVFASAVLLNDGYGLGFRIIVNADKIDVAFDHLVAWMDGLTWVTP